MTNAVNYSTQTRYIPFPVKFEVGQRIYCGLYGGKDGTIIAIHGQQAPETIHHHKGVMVMGGRATIDVAWDTRGDTGGYSKQVPEGIARSVQWKMLSGYKDPQQAIAESEAFIALEEAKAIAAKAAFEKGKETVKEKYSFLTVDDGTDRNIVQKNLRALLKREFPKVKFKVTKDGYSARGVSWEDGPTVEEVKQFSGPFEEGSFNGMEDIYEYDSTPFNEVFGGCQYIFEHREFSQKVVESIIGKAWAEYKWVTGDGSPVTEKPTYEDYKRGMTRRIYIQGWGEEFSQIVWKELSKASF